MAQLTAEKLSRKTKIFYGAGDFGFSLTDTVIGVLYAIFLTDVIRVPARYAGMIFLVGRVWDFVNDPLMGYISDRTRTRWGRRRPFLLFGLVPFAATYALIWVDYTHVDAFSSVMALLSGLTENPFGVTAVIFYSTVYLLYDAAATLVYMPYFALTPELTLDYDERTDLTTYRMFFSILAGLIGFVVPFIVIDEAGPGSAGDVALLGVAFGIASALPLLLTFFGTRERPEFIQQDQPALGKSIRAALRNKPFVFAMFIFLFTWTALNLVQSMLTFFVKYRVDRFDQFDLIAGTVFVTAMLTLPIWEWASRKMDKRRAYILGMIFLSGVLTVLAFIPSDVGLRVILLLAFLAGIGVAAVHVLPWSMIPDAVEWDEYESGARHEGMFYSLVTLLRKIASAIALPSMLWIMDANGFDSSLPQQPESALGAISWLTGPGPAAFMFAGIVFALVYPLSREKHASIRKELEARRAADSAA